MLKQDRFLSVFPLNSALDEENGMLCVYSLTENLVVFMHGLVKDAIQAHLHILHAPHP